MRNRSRAAGDPAARPGDPTPPRVPRPRAGDADGFGLDDLFDQHREDQHRDDQHREDQRRDTVTSAPRRGPRPPREGFRPTGRRIAVVVAVATVVVAAGAALGIRAALDDDSPDTAASPAASRPDIGSPPAEMPATGTAIRSRLTADGDVEVTQWIRSRFPVIDLGLPTPPDGTGGARVRDLTVVADGMSVEPLRDAADPTVRFAFGVPARLVYLRYVLTRAVDESPSVPGRALVRTTFLRLEYSPLQGPAVVTVTAPEVLSMTCSNRQAVLSSPRPCGTPVAGGWRVTLRDGHRQDDVMAQVDLGR